MHFLNLTCQWLSPLFTIYTYTSILLQWARIQANHCLTTCKRGPGRAKWEGCLPKKQALKSFFFHISTLYPPLRKKLPNVLYGGRIEALFADLSIYCIVLHSHHVARSNPGINTIWGLGLFLVLFLAPRGFSGVLCFFLLLKNQHFQIPFDLECTGTLKRVKCFVGKQITSYNYRIK